jgi:fatty acid desaturase
MSDSREEAGSYQPGENFCPPESTRRAYARFMIAAALVGTIMTAITARFGNPVAPYILGLLIAPLWVWVGVRATFFPTRRNASSGAPDAYLRGRVPDRDSRPHNMVALSPARSVAGWEMNFMPPLPLCAFSPLSNRS